MLKHDLIIIGGGSAGMAAAYGAYLNGIKDILVIEREKEYGGILQQCIHNGFGLHTFNEELSGPAYAEKYYERLRDIDSIHFIYESSVTAISEKTVTVLSPKGERTFEAKAVILASGCRERPAGAIGLKGDRCEGIYTAGTAQKYLNKAGYLVGKRVFILGSGDIGLIMARRMTLEGAKVIGVAELQPYSNGLARNIKQCLEDFDIPLYLSHTVEAVKGTARVEKIVLIEVDEKLQKIPGSEQEIECDCLLLSVGLIPDNTLLERCGVRIDPRTKGAFVDDNYMTSLEGIFACGNSLHVHDLVDYVSAEGERCGRAAANYILHQNDNTPMHLSVPQEGIGYVVPQQFHKEKDQEFMFRVRKVYKDSYIHIYGDGFEKKIRKTGIVPSEMQKVILKKEELKDLEGDLFWEVIG